MEKITVGDQEYELLFNMYTMEQLEEKYGDTRKAIKQLTESEKLQARTNIGAAAAAEFVGVNSQSFTSSQQAQARENIGAIGVNDAVSVNAQTLTTSQQEQVRTNIGAVSSGIIAGLFKITSHSHTLTEDIQPNFTQVLDETSFSVTPVPGYSLVGIIRWDIGHKGLDATALSANATGGVYVTITNRISSATGAQTWISIQCLWCKSELLS